MAKNERAAQRRALAALALAEERAMAAYRRIAKRLRRKPLTLATVDRAVQRAFTAELPDVATAITAGVRIAAEHGALVGSTAVSSRVLTTIVEGIDAPTPALSRTIWLRDAVTRRQMAAAIKSSIRTGASVASSTDSLVAASDVTAELPRYVRELSAAARGASDETLAHAIRRHVRYIDRLGRKGVPDAGIRAASKDLLQRLPHMGRDSIDRQIRQWAIDKGRYNARRILRTEGVRAFSDAYKAAAPPESAFRWNRQAGHDHPDVCDMHADLDREGLGRGVYTAAALPSLPAHPGCLCYLTTVLDPVKSSEPTSAATYLRAQPRGRQVELLGPGRAKWLAEASGSEAERILAGSSFRPLYSLKRSAKPSGPARPKADPSKRAVERAVHQSGQ